MLRACPVTGVLGQKPSWLGGSLRNSARAQSAGWPSSAPFDEVDLGRPIHRARGGEGGDIAAETPNQFVDLFFIQSTHATSPTGVKRFGHLMRRRSLADFACRQPAAHAPTGLSFSLRGRVARTKGENSFFIFEVVGLRASAVFLAESTGKTHAI
jgi:hypothetical protein